MRADKKSTEGWRTTKTERCCYIIGDFGRSLEGTIVTTLMSMFLIFQGIDLAGHSAEHLFRGPGVCRLLCPAGDPGAFQQCEQCGQDFFSAGHDRIYQIQNGKGLLRDLQRHFFLCNQADQQRVGFSGIIYSGIIRLHTCGGREL